MRLPMIAGRIARRILVNYRVDPVVMSHVVPPPFRPRIVRGYAVAGICLIRLDQIRPQGFPTWVGVASENAAHRIAVEWDGLGGTHTGVFIPRRDTSSWMNVLAGGRLFPGVHGHARFRATENEGRLRLDVQGAHGLSIRVAGRVSPTIPGNSVFRSVEEAAQFFREGSEGYSITTTPGRYDGVELQLETWNLEAFAVDEVASSYFDDERSFPAGSATFDSAFLMRDIRHAWHSLPDVFAAACAPAVT